MEREPLLVVLVRAALVLVVSTLARPAVAFGDWLVRLAAYLERRPAPKPSNTVLLGFAALAAAALGSLLLLPAHRPAPRRDGLGPPATHTLHPAPPPIRTRWLTTVGAYKVERIRAPQTGLAVDRSRPPVGIGHTTECGLNTALKIFRRHDAPHFLLGRDDLGRIRVFQFVPLGAAAGSLRNLHGGVETNAWARAQIELTAYSHARRWAPDPELMHAFEQLLVTLHVEAGIPLARPYRDGWSARADALRRASGRWGHTAGWFNHGEVPEQNHWDMGGFEWQVALAGARAQERLATSAARVDPPRATQ